MISFWHCAGISSLVNLFEGLGSMSWWNAIFMPNLSYVNSLLKNSVTVLDEFNQGYKYRKIVYPASQFYLSTHFFFGGYNGFAIISNFKMASMWSWMYFHLYAQIWWGLIHHAWQKGYGFWWWDRLALRQAWGLLSCQNGFSFGLICLENKLQNSSDCLSDRQLCSFFFSDRETLIEPISGKVHLILLFIYAPRLQK